jgi:hypothetical protein
MRRLVSATTCLFPDSTSLFSDPQGLSPMVTLHPRRQWKSFFGQYKPFIFLLWFVLMMSSAHAVPVFRHGESDIRLSLSPYLPFK